jgi:putative SOS response-associated peptidase YedK
MCGRFVRQTDIDDIVREFSVVRVACDLAPSYNIAPTQKVAIVIQDGVKQLMSVRWGLVPYWADDLAIGSKLINARIESIAERASFKEAFTKRRCLIIADGFYEWRNVGGKKTPIFIRPKDGKAFGFAGIYENWISPQGERIATCAIITTEANEAMKPIHHRMPVIVHRELEDRWLDPAINDPGVLCDLLKTCPPREIETYQVSRLVNSADNDSPECLMPASEAPKPEQLAALPWQPSLFADD